MKIICFHNPDEENGYLSNWYHSDFSVNGIDYSSMEQLQATGNAVLAECAVRDCIWGIGLSMHDPERLDQNQWRGQNLLGYTLMMVRDRLK